MALRIDQLLTPNHGAFDLINVKSPICPGFWGGGGGGGGLHLPLIGALCTCKMKQLNHGGSQIDKQSGSPRGGGGGLLTLGPVVNYGARPPGPPCITNGQQFCYLRMLVIVCMRHACTVYNFVKLIVSKFSVHFRFL